MAPWSSNTNDSGLIFIERSHLFKSLSEEDGKQLLASGERISYLTGDVILREGDEGRHFYLLKQGQVVVTIEREGEEIELATLKTGAFFGEVSLLTGQKRTANVTALDEVDAIRFENELVAEILQSYPKIRELLQAIVIGRARDTITKLRDTQI